MRDEGTEESARRAVLHFRNQLRVNTIIDDDEGFAITKRNIAILQIQCMKMTIILRRR